MRDPKKKDKYLTARAKGLSKSAAAKKAGICRRTGIRAEKNPEIQNAMARALEKAGATEDKIAEVVARNLDAQKVISANIIAKGGEGMADAHGMTKDFIEVPDGAVQLKAAELAGKFRGDFIEKKQVEHVGGVKLITNVEDED